ncbi:MAG: hypothetical protein ACJ79S_13190 [Gemmatimonadaceae bacterium]
MAFVALELLAHLALAARHRPNFYSGTGWPGIRKAALLVGVAA